jgi:hypothetical protein
VHEKVYGEAMLRGLCSGGKMQSTFVYDRPDNLCMELTGIDSPSLQQAVSSVVI